MKAANSLIMIAASAALICTTAALAQSIQIATPERSAVFTLKELKKKLPQQTVTVDDPNYDATKKFDGFALKDVLRLVAAGQDLRAEELIFTSADGYAPGTTAEKFEKYTPYLVYQEHGHPFAPLQQGKASVSPGPFYVVWKEGAKIKNEVPWPYQVTKIEWTGWASKFPLVVPKEKSAMAGFLIFKDRCIRCHSINLQGGDLGPELNIPMNVTEYWEP
jgi:hypothetical protein